MAGKILVLGGTGTVGKPLVAALLAKGAAVKVGSRSGTAEGGAEGVRFDYADPATFAAALDGVDRAYVITPAGHTDPLGLMSPILKAARERDVKVVLQTAKGVDADDNIPYRQIELSLIHGGGRYVILRPDWFADNFHSYWREGVRHGVIAVPAADGRSGFIDVRDIADSAAAVLTTDRFDNEAYVLTGPEALTYAEAASVLSQAIGRPVAYQAIDGETFTKNLVGFGVPEAYAGFLAAIFHPVAQGWNAGLSDAVERLTGKPPRSLATYAADHLGQLQG